MRTSGPRLGSGNAGLSAEISLVEASVGDKTVLHDDASSMFGQITNNGSSTWGTQVRVDRELGPTTLRVKVRVRLKQAFESPSDDGSWTQEFSVPFLVVPKGTPLVEPVYEESLRDGMAGLIRISRLNLSPDARITANFDVSGNPVAVAGEILYRFSDAAGEHEARGGTLTLPAGSAGTWGVGSNFLSPCPAAGSRVDVVLRPDVRAAELNPDVVKFWSTPIIFRGVPVVPGGALPVGPPVPGIAARPDPPPGDNEAAQPGERPDADEKNEILRSPDPS